MRKACLTDADADLLLDYIEFFINHDQLSSTQKIDVIKECIDTVERIKQG